MFLRSLQLFAATLLAALLAVGCGGDSAPAPTGVTVAPGDTTATLTWPMVDGVEYWLFFGPTSVAPTDTASMHNWIGLPTGNVMIKVTSPYRVTGLYNGIAYSFSLNGRIDGGPGGQGSIPVSTTPRLAGASWVAGAANSAGSSALRSVAYGAKTTTTTTTAGTVNTTVTTFVAAGVGGAMYSSLDGAAWSPIGYSTIADLNGAFYFGVFKVVGNGGLVLVSSDAVAWNTQTTPTTANLYAIATNSVGLSVAVGANGTIIVSADGTNWIAATSSGTTRDLYAVAFNTYSGTWVAVGAGGTIVTSTDGLTWRSAPATTPPTTADLRGVAFGGNSTLVGASAFVAVGASGTVLSSVDGSAWVARALPGGFTGTLNGITNGGQYVAVGVGGKIFISADGISWAAASSSNTNDLYAVVHGQYDYSAVGVAGTNLLSK